MITTILLCLLTVLLFIKCKSFIDKWRRQQTVLSSIPGPPVQNFLLGNLDQFYIPGKPLQHSIGDGLMNLSRRFADDGLYKFYIGPKPIVCVFHADYFQEILSNPKFVKKSNEYRFVRHWLGDGLANSEPNKWRQRRKILLPAFYSTVLNQFIPIFNANAHKLCEKLLDTPKQLDLTETTIKVTMDIVCQTALGMSDDNDSNYLEYANSLQKVTGLLVHQMFTPYLWINQVFSLTQLGREMVKHSSIMRNFVHSVVSERKKYILSEMQKVENNLDANCNDVDMRVPKSQLLLLDCLLKAHFDGMLSLEDVKDEINTFTFAGHDTVGISTAFTLFVLAHHRDVQEKVQQELDEVLGDVDGPLDLNSDTLSRLKYLEAVIKEVNRLFPPGPTYARQLTADVQLGPHRVPEGTDVWFNVKALHMDSNLYPEPEKFKPERFLGESSNRLHPYGYATFSLGPRNCVGQKYAIIELKTILAHVLKRFTVSSDVPIDDLVLTFEIILRCKTPLTTIFTPRSSFDSPYVFV